MVIRCLVKFKQFFINIYIYARLLFKHTSFETAVFLEQLFSEKLLYVKLLTKLLGRFVLKEIVKERKLRILQNSLKHGRQII